MSTFVDTKTVSGGKYFEAFVPDYDTTNARDSYIRLGVPAETDPSQSGANMWSKYTKWLDQSNYDHVRNRNGHDLRPPFHGDADTPAKFETHLGWRDHTDGNRLTTTQGDKIEVIGGNYQLLVLGRQNDPGNGVIWDASGGFIADDDIAPGAITKIEYKAQKFGGTWKVTETTEKGHVHEIFKGEFREEFYGSSKTSITGRETAGSDPWDANPALVETTYATSIREDFGSSTTRIPTMTSNTYADTINETVDASGAITNETTAESVTETFNLSGKLTSNVYAASIVENYGKASKHTSLDSTFYGWRNELTFGGVSETILGGKVDTFVGGHFSMDLARCVALILLAHTEVHLGSFREITIGYKWDLVVGWELEVDDYSTTIDKVSKKSFAASIFLG